MNENTSATAADEKNDKIIQLNQISMQNIKL